MGPSCAVADLKAGRHHSLDRLPIHSPVPHNLRRKASNCPRRKSGSFTSTAPAATGRTAHEDAAADAAILSKAVGARFVCSGCGRTSTAGIPRVRRTSSTCAAAVMADGQMAAWETELWVPMFISAKGTIPLVGLDAAGIKQRQGRWPGSVDENLDPPYTTSEREGNRASAKGLAVANGSRARSRKSGECLRGREPRR